MKCQLKIDSKEFEYEVDGAFHLGHNEILIDYDNNAIANTEWRDIGYQVIQLFSDKEFHDLRVNLLQVLNEILTSLGLPCIEKLENYHQIINSKELHEQVISKSRFLRKDDFKIDLDQVFDRISNELGKVVSLYNPRLDEEIIILRISRPDNLDINPLHRDGYLDIYRNTVNVWIPIAGCNEKSSLPVIPGSHYWNEKDVLKTNPKGASIDGQKYHVPGIVKGPKLLEAIRPDPRYGQALLFSPYLIHGSAINMNQDITRMSLELRPCLV